MLLYYICRNNYNKLITVMKSLPLFRINKNLSRAVFLFILVLFSFSTETQAHGINFETAQESPVVIVKAYFSRASPVAGALVEVYAPGDEQPYQTGRSDAEGYFAFLPDRLGEWSVRVDDERGHAGRVAIAVSASFFEHDDAAEEAVMPMSEKETAIAEEKGLSTFYKVVIGLVLIFGLTGIIYGVKAQQALKNRKQKN